MKTVAERTILTICTSHTCRRTHHLLWAWLTCCWLVALSCSCLNGSLLVPAPPVVQRCNTMNSLDIFEQEVGTACLGQCPYVLVYSLGHLAPCRTTCRLGCHRSSSQSHRSVVHQTQTWRRSCHPAACLSLPSGLHPWAALHQLHLVLWCGMGYKTGQDGNAAPCDII